MIQLIWGILNILAFFGFIAFCLKKAVEIRHKIGLSVTILFCFFVLSFITKPGNAAKDKKFEFQDKEVVQNLHHNTFFTEITLEQDLTTKFKMNVLSDNQNTVSATVTRTGFISGTEWHTDYIDINKTEKKNFYQYSVGGTRKWKILGIEVYIEFKQFRGTKEFKPY